jgi:PAS domain S-box-containing protein
MEVRGKIKCWEFFNCDEQECPVSKSKELRCWLVSETHCRNEIQGKFIEKIEMCIRCEVFKANIDVDSMEQTLTVVNRQFTEFGQMVDERDRELEHVSMELALGLSEVFEALGQISSGDPEVKIPETSELELITKLKHMVNMTAINLAGIVNLSHEFAIGLAEHFDVLNRVSKGDLTAKVSGISQVELLEYLKKVTNQMIENVSEEMTERKRAEEALRQYRDQLEEQVKHRTAELTRANELLQQEIRDRKCKEEALQASEEKYSSLVKNSLTGIYIDQDGKIVFANKRFAEIYRYSDEELLGMESWRLVHPDDKAFTDGIRTERLEGKDAPSEYEAKGLTKDGETIWIARRNARIEYQGRPAILGNVVNITEAKRAEEKLKIYHKRLRSLASKLSLAEERERRRISTEVHDNVGQNLAFTKIKLGNLLESVTSPDHRAAVNEISKLVDETIQDTRSLISQLGSPVLYELGFVPAVTRQRHQTFAGPKGKGHC